MSEQKIQQAQISVKEFPICVRIRKGMYISNLNQMVTEIIDNSVDEHVAGYCFNIAVIIDEKNKTYTVQDDGRGIPVTPHPNYKDKSQVEIAFTTLHGGGKFNDVGGYEAKTGGMNGVGGSCVQALSDSMCIQIATDNKKYQIDFSKGYVTKKIRLIEENVDERGTTVTFHPDEEIWQNEEPLNIKALRKRIKQLAYLNPGLNFFFFAEGPEQENPEIYCFEKGLKQYVEELTKSKKRITDIIGVKTEVDNIDVHLALAYSDSYNEELYTFCNNMATSSNGDHLTGFTLGLTSAIKQYKTNYNIDFDMKNEDIKEGLVGIVSVGVSNPNFEGQSKTKLVMKSVKEAVRNITENLILDFLDKNPEIAKTILDKIELAGKARTAAARARELSRKNKTLIESGTPTKLAECSSKNPEECEIYIVEGDSAGGSAKQARNRIFQAILPIFGKILNVEKVRLLAAIANEKIGLFVKAIKTGIGEEFDITKCRYHKIIIMTDADVDGYHIQCLWLTFIYRYMRPLIEAGYVYLAKPPLYKLKYKRKIDGYTYSKEEKATIIYVYSDQDKEDIQNELGKADDIQRYKGLGEMNPEQLWNTTMNPETRKLDRITLQDAEDCEQSVTLCMSDDSIARREWIMENATSVEVDV